MAMLRVSLFGGFRIHDFSSTGEVKTTNNLQSLLAYLLLFRQRTHSRDIIMELFWGEYDQQHARACLNTALWRLRQILEPDGVVQKGTYLLSSNTGEIGFNCDSNYWLDVADFEQNILPILNRPLESLQLNDAQRLEQALLLYHGELLEGFYDDWALHERERCREMYLSALYHLMHYYAQQRLYSESLRCGQRILRSDPLREHIHRDLIQLYLDSGQRDQAVRQYKTCQQVLAAELGITPMPETRQLYERIVGKPSSEIMSHDFHHELHELLAQFAELQERLRNFARQFDDPRR